MIEKIRKFVIEKMSDRKCGETRVRRRGRNIKIDTSKTAKKKMNRQIKR